MCPTVVPPVSSQDVLRHFLFRYHRSHGGGKSWYLRLPRQHLPVSFPQPARQFRSLDSGVVCQVNRSGCRVGRGITQDTKDCRRGVQHRTALHSVISNISVESKHKGGCTDPRFDRSHRPDKYMCAYDRRDLLVAAHGLRFCKLHGSPNVCAVSRQFLVARIDAEVTTRCNVS